MLQLLQNLSTGQTFLLDVPAPSPQRGALIVNTKVSVISAGTERMLVDFSRSSLLGKIRQQPERVGEVLAKIKSNGLWSTLKAIRSKLSQPIPLGYCNVGIVHHSCSSEFLPGDRVISNAPHAEVITVSSKLAARIPASVDDTSASFVPLAAIALQGIHLLDAKCGDKVLVTGLGLIGQLAVQLLVARGCEVMGLDPSSERCKIAAMHGAFVGEFNDPVAAALSWTNGKGVVGVIITASSATNEIVSQSARSCGKRGKVVLIGVVGLNLNRMDFYKNEVSFQVSCSYGERSHTGPGSARANFEEVLSDMSSGTLKVKHLVTQRFPFEQSTLAYNRLTSDKSVFGLVLDYNGKTSGSTEVNFATSIGQFPSFSILGAGNFAMRTLLPALADQGARPSLIISSQGYQAALAARQFGPSTVLTDELAVLAHRSPNIVFICTRHDAHARQAIGALEANKSVWVEKPLALNLEDLAQVEIAAKKSKGVLMIGFNRRFAPATVKISNALIKRPGPKKLYITINAGRLDSSHWSIDPYVGGGRIVGEACHFVDLARVLVGCSVKSIQCIRRDADGQDGGCFQLLFADESIAVIDYRTDMPPYMPKEKIAISGEDWSAEIHNWSRLTSRGLGVSMGWPWSRAPKKGHPEAIRAFFAAIAGKAMPIPLSEMVEVSKVSILMQSMAYSGERVENFL